MGESHNSRGGFGPLRICVTGPECSGKSTLALALARHYRAPVVHEYGKDHFTDKLRLGDPRVHTGDLLKVITEQSRLEDNAAAWTGPVIICDTDALTVTIWAPVYLGERHPHLEAFVHERRSAGKGIDLYLLCQPDIPFEADGIRVGDAHRKSMYPTFVDRLVEEGVPFKELSGSAEKRLADAIQVVDALVQSQHAAVEALR